MITERIMQEILKDFNEMGCPVAEYVEMLEEDKECRTLIDRLEDTGTEITSAEAAEIYEEESLDIISDYLDSQCS